ncbi:unnamed protein product [Discosporangium mesarthrocarpum]
MIAFELLLVVFGIPTVHSFVPQVMAYPCRAPANVITRSATEREPCPKEPTCPSTIKGILFDMDGTLTDSDVLHYEAYRETLLQVVPQFNEGKPITRGYYNEWMSGNSNPTIVSKLVPDMPAEEQTALWQEKEEVYRRISTKMTPLPGLFDFLEKCERAGIAMIVVTNAPRIDAVHTLNILGLMDRFGDDFVIGYECPRSKPHPEPYLEGLARLGLTAEACVAFEDSVNGVTSAVAAGLYTVGVGITRVESLQSLGAGICVQDFRDSRLSEVLGIE